MNAGRQIRQASEQTIKKMNSAEVTPQSACHRPIPTVHGLWPVKGATCGNLPIASRVMRQRRPRPAAAAAPGGGGGARRQRRQPAAKAVAEGPSVGRENPWFSPKAAVAVAAAAASGAAAAATNAAAPVVHPVAAPPEDHGQARSPT